MRNKLKNVDRRVDSKFYKILTIFPNSNRENRETQKEISTFKLSSVLGFPALHRGLQLPALSSGSAHSAYTLDTRNGLRYE